MDRGCACILNLVVQVRVIAALLVGDRIGMASVDLVPFDSVALRITQPEPVVRIVAEVVIEVVPLGERTFKSVGRRP